VTLGSLVSSAALPEFVSFTLDWWAKDQGCVGGWGPDANVLEIDLKNPKLKALTSALAPAILRIGGSLDKKVVYAMPGEMRYLN
jgi:heparanase 1